MIIDLTDVVAGLCIGDAVLWLVRDGRCRYTAWRTK